MTLSLSNSWNQPVLSNEGKLSCSRKQQEPLTGLELTTDKLQVRRSALPTAPLNSSYPFAEVIRMDGQRQ